jgi:hypothetical protein
MIAAIMLRERKKADLLPASLLKIMPQKDFNPLHKFSDSVCRCICEPYDHLHRGSLAEYSAETVV